MSLSRIFKVADMSFKAICQNKIPTKISEFAVNKRHANTDRIRNKKK